MWPTGPRWPVPDTDVQHHKSQELVGRGQAQRMFFMTDIGTKALTCWVTVGRFLGSEMSVTEPGRPALELPETGQIQCGARGSVVVNRASFHKPSGNLS